VLQLCFGNAANVDMQVSEPSDCKDVQYRHGVEWGAPEVGDDAAHHHLIQTKVGYQPKVGYRWQAQEVLVQTEKLQGLMQQQAL